LSLLSLGCVAFSGLFSATFPLTFAYIADCVPANERAPAYGLALATLGLSFTIGPPLGGYIDSNFGSRSVFILSFALVIVDILYILFILPETVQENVSLLPLSLLSSALLSSLLVFRKNDHFKGN
jgi:predicted MFS family arabinose efflux permease